MMTYTPSDRSMEIRKLKNRENDRLRPITSFPDGQEDDKYILFNYFLNRASKVGAYMNNSTNIEVDQEKLFMILQLMDPEDINVEDGLSQTVLHIAAQYCKGEDISMLTDEPFKGIVDLNAQDEQGFSPIFYAALANNVDTATALLEQGCNLHLLAGAIRRHVIHVAAMFGSTDILQYLFLRRHEYELNIDIRDAKGQTAIALSAYYRHSNVTALLISLGADPFLQDSSGLCAAVWVANNMPILIRDVFDRLTTEDLLKGERFYNLKSIIDTEHNTKTSFFQFLVWQRNLAVIEHPVFNYLIEEKWKDYGDKPTRNHFVFIYLYSFAWTGLYMTSNSYDGHLFNSEDMFTHALQLVLYVSSVAGYIYSMRANSLLMRGRHVFMLHICEVLRRMYQSEEGLMHPKGLHLLKVAKKGSSTRHLTFVNDIKKAPALAADMVLDQILLLYLVIKILSVLSSANLASVENLYGACAIICLWTNTFLKLQITQNIGHFVVFIKCVPTDLYTVTIMFATLFAPAFLVFYKTIYVKQGVDPGEMLDDAGDDVLDRVRRAAKGAKGSKGSGSADLSPRNVLGTFFVVLRLVLVDYEYEDGLHRSEPPFWWMIISLVWIVVSSIIVLNLMIAIMADSYSRIYERSAISARVRRAQTIVDLERKMGREDLSGACERISQRSPIKVEFDPVCDRDKAEVVTAKVGLLTRKVSKLEQTVNNQLFVNLKRRLDFIETKVNINSYKPIKGSLFFQYK